MLKCMELYLHPPCMSSWHEHRQLSLLLNSAISHTLCVFVCMCMCACERNCGSACARYQNRAPKHYTTIDKDIKLSKFWITIMYLVSRNDQYIVSADVCKDAELQLSYILAMVQNNSWILLYNNFSASKTTEKTLKWNVPWYASDTTT